MTVYVAMCRGFVHALFSSSDAAQGFLRISNLAGMQIIAMPVFDLSSGKNLTNYIDLIEEHENAGGVIQ